MYPNSYNFNRQLDGDDRSSSVKQVGFSAAGGGGPDTARTIASSILGGSVSFTEPSASSTSSSTVWDEFTLSFKRVLICC